MDSRKKKKHNEKMIKIHPARQKQSTVKLQKWNNQNNFIGFNDETLLHHRHLLMLAAAVCLDCLSIYSEVRPKDTNK